MRFGRVKVLLGHSILLCGAGCGEVKSTAPDAAEAPDASIDATPDASVDGPPPAVPMNTTNAGTVAENATLSLAGVLVTTDTDTAASALSYTVRSLPADGMLMKDAAELAIGATFTQQEVDDGRLSYVHDGAENAADGFNWDLTDGITRIPLSGTSTFAITVTPVNDAPVIVNNPVTSVAEAGAEILTNAKLMVSDIEGTAALTYTFVSITRGQLQKKIGAGAFTALTANQTFTQADIAGGNVRFVDSGADDTLLAMQQSTTASFSWRVSDAEGGVNPSATTTNLTTFTVTPVDDPPTANFFANRCYVTNVASAANPVQALTDPDNTAAEYQICVVSIGTGDSVVFSGTTSTVGTTVTGIVPSLKNGAAVLSVNSCVVTNALGALTFTTTATRFGGSVTWKLMKGATQIGPNRTTNFVKSSPPC